MRFQSAVLVAAMACTASWTVQGQVLTQRSVSLQLARTIADAALAACTRDGFDVTAAVVDRAGDVVLVLRSDRANPHNAELARRKAYTSRTFNITSLEFRNRTAGASEFAGQRQLFDVIPLGGGVPIRVGTEIIGGLGLSGSPMQEADEKCALAGLAAAASQLK